MAADKVKPVLDRYALPAMPKVHRDFLAWVARYTCSPLGSVLKMSLERAGRVDAAGAGYWVSVEGSR